MKDQRRQERNREDRIVKELLKLVAENEYMGEMIYRDLAKRAKRKIDRRRLDHLIDEKRDHHGGYYDADPFKYLSDYGLRLKAFEVHAFTFLFRIHIGFVYIGFVYIVFIHNGLLAP